MLLIINLSELSIISDADSEIENTDNLGNIFLNNYINESKDKQKISTIEVIHGPNRPGDIPHSHASINKAKEKLSYNPQFNLRQGLKEAVKWYWKNLSVK